MAGFRERLLGLAGRVEARARQVAPAVRLARSNSGAMRAYLRYRNAVAASIGEGEAEAYAALVVQVSTVDGELARVIALAVPDQLARVPAPHRHRYFAALEFVLETRPPALPMVARALPELLGGLDDEALRVFLERGLDLHAVSHQKAESFLRQESGAGQVAARAFQKGVALRDVSRTLTLYARAHCGEDVQVRGGEGRAFTDGHHIYLPEVVDQYGDARDFAVYRVQTALGAGYLEFGTFDLDLDRVAGSWPDRKDGEKEIERYFRSFSNRVIARDLFQIMEDARVEARLRREYPGIARDLDSLGPSFRGERQTPTAPAARAIEGLARRVWGIEPLPLEAEEAEAIAELVAMFPGLADHDVTDIAAAVARSFPRVEALMQKAEEGERRQPAGGDGRPARNPNAEPSFQPPPNQPRLEPERAAPEDREREDRAQRLRERIAELGEQVSLAEARQRLKEQHRREEATKFAAMEAMLDRQNIAGGAMVDPERERADDTPVAVKEGLQVDPDSVPIGRNYVYREWDTSIEDYKPRWVIVREHRVRDGSSSFADEVMLRERHHIDSLRRKFEALRPRGMVKLRARTDGNELDMDRVVEMHVDRRVNGNVDDRLYQEVRPERRDVAVAFLLDMSSSTNESASGGTRRIIEVEKEALLVTAEAISALGDPFAVWGFSGYGRDHVAFYVAKDFRDAYDDRVRQRIGRMSFKMENRDGAAIRHATAKLMAQPARSRILILLSDGKPLDCGCDHYFDRYAQDDTRAALREARQAGIHPFCITVDPTGPAYLPKMYGDVAYTVIDRVDKLPAQLLRVYRRLAL